jgi:hypothetical protein
MNPKKTGTPCLEDLSRMRRKEWISNPTGGGSFLPTERTMLVSTGREWKSAEEAG